MHGLKKCRVTAYCTLAGQLTGAETKTGFFPYDRPDLPETIASDSEFGEVKGITKKRRLVEGLDRDNSARNGPGYWQDCTYCRLKVNGNLRVNR